MVFDFGVRSLGDHVLAALPLSKAKLLLHIPSGVFGLLGTCGSLTSCPVFFKQHLGYSIPPLSSPWERAIRENILVFNFTGLTQAWKASIHSCLHQRSGFSVRLFSSLSLPSLAWKKAAEPQVMQFD